MEFNEKLQELRKQKGLTQEQLAKALFVSRAAISKWESGRGYPNIDSLKAIAKLYNVSIDELLSGDELLSVAQEDRKQMKNHFCDLLFGLLDILTAVLFIVPIFGCNSGANIYAVSLLSLSGVSPYLKWLYLDCVSSMVLCGILTLALQNCSRVFWVQSKRTISMLINAYGVLLFVMSRQPYPAILLLLFLAIKTIFVAKKQ